MSYTATGLPAGLSMNNTTGLISGTPTVTGTFLVTITLANAYGSRPDPFTLTILPVQPTPVITSATTANGTTGAPFSYQITASNSPTSYNTTGLPAGLAVNRSTGAITGTPTSTGSTSVSILAINSLGTGSATLTIIVPPLTDTPAMPSWALGMLAVLLVAVGLRSLPKPALKNLELT